VSLLFLDLDGVMIPCGAGAVTPRAVAALRDICTACDARVVLSTARGYERGLALLRDAGVVPVSGARWGAFGYSFPSGHASSAASTEVLPWDLASGSL
jgi:membrane-associated phospholipid phosphatase